MMLRRGSATLGFGLALALSSCALPTPPAVPEVARAALPNMTTPAAWTAGAAAGAVSDNWLTEFQDPQLDALVREALAYNPDLRIAAARVEQAAGYVELAGATLYPQVSLLAKGGGKLSGDTSGLSGVGIFANWELDVWGRIRAGRAASERQFDSAALETEFARQSIAALVAKSWVLAIEAKLQQQLAMEMVAGGETLARLAADRLRVGKGDEYEVTLAKANLQTYRDAVQQFDLSYQQALRALEVLAGRYPAAQLEVAQELPKSPGPVPAGMPSELLERRPDVIAAERRVAAAFYRVEEAKAARLPTLSLTAGLTTLSSDLFVLQERNNPVASIGGALFAPIFLGGKLESQVQIRSAEQKQAIAEFGKVGAKAFSDVESALAAGNNAQQRTTVLTESVSLNQKGLELATIRYKVGSSDLRAVEQQQLALYVARSALLRMRSEALVQRVNLHLAVGGSFEIRPAAASGPQTTQ
jgi:NodT family efflux transporter outer membrane factor (OMF) lipoprotein